MKGHLEAEDTADEEQHDEHQAHVTERSDLVLVREVVRLHRKQKSERERGSVEEETGNDAFSVLTSCCR